MAGGRRRVTDPASEASEPPLPGRGVLRDWRVWVGLAVSAACLLLVVRGAPLDEVRRALAEADLALLLGVSAPAYVANVWLRALRWRHLTNPIAPVSRTLLYRAQGLGFAVNNLAPLRAGELVRCWFLAREARLPPAAVLGTVVLERVIDVATMLSLVAAALLLLGTGEGEGGLLARGAQVLLPAALAPLAGLVAMRLAPELFVRGARRLCRPLPAGLATRVEEAVRGFVDGLQALSRGRHLFWILLHSLLMWLVASTLPLLAGVWAFDLDLGPPARTLVACWLLLGAIAAAVAVPSAPGFLGPYQLASREVLVRFGVDPATALAVAVALWGVFWLCLTLQGLAALPVGRRRPAPAPPPGSRTQ